MTTEEMRALPIGVRVRAIRTGVLYEKVKDSKYNFNSYQCTFRKVGKRGLSANETFYFGSLIRLEEQHGEDCA